MKKRNIFFTLAAMLLLTGCSEDVEQNGGQVKVPVQAVTSGCSEYKSTGIPVASFAESMRAATGLYTSATGFDGGEQVRVGMNYPATPQAAIYDVAAPVGTDKKSELSLAATETAPIYFPGTASGTVKLYGMYPTSMTHTVKYDQSSTSMVGDANYKASDLMFGVTDVTWTTLSEKRTLKPNIEFQHQLVKLTLTVVKKEGVKQLQEIRLHNVKRQVEITAFSADGLTLGTPASPTDESASDGDNKDEIVITGAQAESDAEATYTMSCVFPAQAWNDGADGAVDFLTVKADDYTHTYKLLRNTWTAGTDYQLVLNLLPLEANETVTITDWTSDTSYAIGVEGGFKIQPLRTEPTAIDNLHYTGAAQELVTGGSAVGGTLYYYCSTTNSRPAADAAGWSTDVPTGTEQTTYYVWTKVVASSSDFFDLDVSETPVTITIDKPLAGLTVAPAPVSGLQYTGAAQNLITAGTADGGTLKYYVTTDAPDPSRMLGSLPDGNRAAPATEDFSEDIPTGTEVGTYYVWYYVEGDADHASTDPVMLDPISISKATATVTSSPKVNFTFVEGDQNDLVRAGVTNDGDLMYLATTTESTPSKTNVGWSTNIPQVTTAGTYYVYYYVKADDDHEDSDVAGPVRVRLPYKFISGNFKINSSGTKVKFSQGNLQATWDGTIWNWAFAAHQWDAILNTSGNVKVNGNGTVSEVGVTVDLFGWVGASNTSWNGVNGSGSTVEAAMHGICYYKYSTYATSGSNSYYGTNAYESLKSDWGNVNITNSEGYTWRTLTQSEMQYIFQSRASGAIVNNVTNARYTPAKINTDETSVTGLILFPDGVTLGSDLVTSWGTINSNNGKTNSTFTQCTSDEWMQLEASGCVFLPLAGYRTGSTVGTNSFTYWTNTSDGTGQTAAVSMQWDNSFRWGGYGRDYGSSVRLVRVVP